MDRWMPYVWLILTDLACVASGTYLVHGWAWIPFLFAACNGVKTTK